MCCDDVFVDLLRLLAGFSVFVGFECQFDFVCNFCLIADIFVFL